MTETWDTLEVFLFVRKNHNFPEGAARQKKIAFLAGHSAMALTPPPTTALSTLTLWEMRM